MKALLSIALSLFIFNAWAGIIRVNKNAGSSADFTSLQVAIDSASPGDTIYLEPAGTNYGNITINKRVNIYGPGPLNFQNPGLQATTFAAKVNDLNISPGGELSGITGIEIQNQMNINTGAFAITRCYFSRGAPGNVIYINNTNSAANILIAQCYIDGNISHSTAANSTQIEFRNNFMDTYILSDNSTSFEFVNNVLRYNQASNVYNTIFTNNVFILFGSGTSTINVANNNAFFNNLIVGTTWAFDTADGNINGETAANVFVGSTGNSLDGQWQLKSGSPAIDAGLQIPNGTPTDIGMFGGPAPYVLGGVPALPTIYELVVPASNTTGQLNVTIRARSQE